jgi:signal transduction histidine kinase
MNCISSPCFDNDDLERMSHVLRHRLRNIASGISGAVGLIASEADSTIPADLREYFPLMLRECDSLSDMATRLGLFWERDPEIRPANADEITVDVIAAVAHQFPNVELRRRGEAAAAVPSIMRIALQEILSNACEAAPRGIVGVDLQAQDDGVTWTVSDSGPGIEAALRAQAFLPFYTTRPRHLGLGLALAQRLARYAGGDCAAETAQRRANEWTVIVTCPSLPSGSAEKAAS